MSPICFAPTPLIPRSLSVALVFLSMRPPSTEPCAARRVMIPRLSVVMSLSPPKRFAATVASPQYFSIRLGTFCTSPSGAFAISMRRETSETIIASMRQMSVKNFSAAATATGLALGRSTMRASSFFSASISRDTSPW